MRCVCVFMHCDTIFIIQVRDVRFFKDKKNDFG